MNVDPNREIVHCTSGCHGQAVGSGEALR